jgi:hypothetical protein
MYGIRGQGREYRRGIAEGIWQRLWHYHEECPSYPRRNFAIRKAKPSDDELCSRCGSQAWQ